MSNEDNIALEIASTQEIILQNLKTITFETMEFKSNLFEFLSSSNEAIAKNALGKNGIKLINYAKDVDFTHPLANQFLFSHLDCDKNFYNVIVELFELSEENINNKKWNSILAILQSKIRYQYEDSINKLKRITPRFIADPEQRKTDRQSKKSKQIDLGMYLDEVGENQYFKHKKSFLRYAKDDTSYTDEIKRLKYKIKKMQDMGLQYQIERLNKDIGEIEQIPEGDYLGFRHIKMRDAALILARVLDFDYNRLNNSILVPRSFFKDHNFWGKSNSNYDIDVEWDSDPMCDRGSSDKNFYTYCPRAYPLPKFKADMTEGTTKLMQYVDAHEQLNNKPLFDYYWVITPGISMPKDMNGGWTLFLDGEKKSFNDYWSCYSKLDAYLTNKGVMCPIILGENVLEKKCYFIGYWV